MLTKRKLLEYGKAMGVSRAETWEELLLQIIDKASVTKAQYQKIESRYQEMGRIIDSSTDPILQGAVISPQGSFLTCTAIRSPTAGIDADVIAWLPKAPADRPMTVLDTLHKELKERSRTHGEVEKKKRCVRVQYADENPEFHIDVTPARNAPNNNGTDGSGQLVVPDTPTRSWKNSFPKGFAHWFDTIALMEVAIEFAEMTALAKAEGVENMPSHEEVTAFDPLRATVKLMKLHRDLYFEGPATSDMKPISVLITTLAGKAYQRVVAESKGKRMTPLAALRRTIELMPHCFDKTPNNGGRWLLKNPVDMSVVPENFAERWNEKPHLSQAFSEWQGDLLEAVDLGLVNFPEMDEFEGELAKAFGRGTAVLAQESYEKAVRLNLEPPGLSADGYRRHRNRSASSKVFGQDLVAPRKKPQEPGSLDRLG